ncbi:type III secretion system protein InvA [Burkholderia ubonensis]|uniref:EscV/YscV/HrcV family type III secretion system export apparatus protein n=1 Tax=Burkholderia ubonensis TaxID=101571 RepID=UPI00075A3E79|nr:EscV/YscV/HrcV family type III secretion system export apparatus protein [Burkholderia ubonensis]KVO87681.1 type III secretion system protein InvA [Burkholderia ubonensis]KVZ57298.1 type III secretion system protein InvA [Burkholderia ubonensis]KVZ72995.1 type III secretion system protein InvA [Burkholderia ubonensis]
MLSTLLKDAKSRPELIIVMLMVTIIAMLIVPLPTLLVDILIALNIVIAILLFMGSFYAEKILSFSTFPTILLITTLFRLALSISTSRLILTQADAGEIISTFGRFVIGDSLVVGFVIFSIVTIVQFIVITKGSERVAEVAARFSLDGMPGKQMSIDGDLRAGVIDGDAAKERRGVLERESQLYGAFDGAMKFIKGDAIAGIIIIVVNLVGGVAVGMSSRGMSLSDAMSTYTLLTIGDGLVSQIPALLISISAGFIVTRINGDDMNLGRNIIRQTLGIPAAVAMTAAVAMLVAIIPGFPTWVFVALSAVLGGYLYVGRRKRRAQAAKSGTPEGDGKKGTTPDEDGIIADLDRVGPETVAFMLLVSSTQLDWFRERKVGERLRSQFFLDYGVKLPEITIRSSDKVEEDHVGFLINEVRSGLLHVRPDRLRVVSAPEGLHELDIDVESYSLNEFESSHWVRPQDAEKLDALGAVTRNPVDELYHCLVPVLVKMVPEFFGIQETKAMLDHVEKGAPDLMKEVMRSLSVQKISEVLQRMLAERISIRNMKLILEALAQWGPREKDVIALVEHVRGAMARYITDKFSVGGRLRVIMISPETEEVIRKGIRQNSGGAFINLDPSVTEEIIDRIEVMFNTVAISQKDVVALTSPDVRRFFKRLIENKFQELDVISFGELTGNVDVSVIKSI